MTTDTPIQRLLSKLPDAKRQGKGWSARCPAHDDRRASLSIGEGEDGRVLVHCHAGCTTVAVCDKLDLMPADLFPPSMSTLFSLAAPNGPYQRHVEGQAGGKSFATAREAVADLEHTFGPRSARWTYKDTSGQPVGVVVRWDPATGTTADPEAKPRKDYRPISLREGRWRIEAMPAPRPLYGLPDLAGAHHVCICEGEKAADAARSIGLIATTSAHGAQSANKTDWTPLAGKEVVILPDGDDAGRKYADDVAALLAKLTPAPVVRIVALPGLPEGGDIVDWIAGHGDAAEPAELARQVEALAAVAAVAVPIKATAADPSWPEVLSLDKPSLPEFPTAVLPGVLRQWVEAESHATQTPADLPGLLSLAVCAATIARHVEVEPRPGWREPVNVFVAPLLEPGNRKSAVFTDALQPLLELEAELIDAARPAVAREQSARRQSEGRLRKLEKIAGEKGDAQAQHDAGDLAEELAMRPEPVLPRLIVDDTTSEKLGMTLAEQGGRIASMSPEGGVFDLMAGLYSKSGIPQFVVYLMGHSGDNLITDRVSRRSVRVERPALTCAYAMQPAVIRGLARNPAFRGRGLLARFLYAAPESWIGHRKTAPTPVSDGTREAYRQAVRDLAELFGNTRSASGPMILGLNPDASAAMLAWETEIEKMLGEGGKLESIRDWGAKLAGATLRLAAVLHCVEHGHTTQIDKPTITAAIEIGRYLVPHAEAVLHMMMAHEPSDDEDAHYVLRWIERHGRREFTKSEAQHHGKRRFPKADDIDPALAELTRRGYIRPKPAETSGPGRPPSPAYEVNPAAFEDAKPEKRSHNSRNSAGEPESGSSGNIGSALEQSETTNRVQVTI